MDYLDKNKLDWWKKHKNKLYGALIAVIGALGGNADRISSFVYDILPDDVVIEESRIEDLENRVQNLEEWQENHQHDLIKDNNSINQKGIQKLVIPSS